MLTFETGEHGKLELNGGYQVQFNVAHSRWDGAYCAVSRWQRGGGCGVCGGKAGVDGCARTAFHPEDLGRIEAGGLAEFYRCWTRKEAVAKADGRGLTMTLTEHEIGCEGDKAMGRYFVQELEVGAGYAAAVACEQAGTAQMLRWNLAGVKGQAKD